MIWRNIKVGFFLIICLFIFNLLFLFLFKLEIIVNGVIVSHNAILYLSLDDANNKYIQKNNIKKVKIIDKNKKYSCKIYFQNLVNNLYIYFLLCNDYEFIDQPNKSINLVVDEINIFQYYLKK